MYYMDELFILFKINYMKIPNEDVNILKLVLWMPKSHRRKILSAVKNMPVWLSARKLAERNKELFLNSLNLQIDDFFEMYFRLVMTKDYLELDTEWFLQEFKQSLINNTNYDLEFLNDCLNLVQELIDNWDRILQTSKAMGAVIDNQRLLIDSDIYQDIRPYFSKSWDLIWAVTFYNIKLRYKEGSSEQKELYLTLDSDDLNELIEKFQKAQNKSKKIKESINNIQLIDLS